MSIRVGLIGVGNCELGLDRGIGGALGGPSGYFMESPPRQLTDDEARRRTETFIADTDGTDAGHA